MAGSTSNPQITVQLLPAEIVDAFADRRDLIVGQTGTAGTAVSGALNQDIQALTTTQIETLFGATSELTHRIKLWLDANGSYSPLDVISVDEGTTPTAATATIVATGTASADGIYTISIVDEFQYSVEVEVTSGDINTVISAAINTAINTLTNPPFTSGVATSTVTLTAVDRGTLGNDYGIKIEGTVPSVTLALTGFSGGLVDPTVTTIFDPIAGLRYTGVNWPEAWASDLSIATTEFDARFNPSNAILDGIVFHGKTDTFANDVSYVGALNSESLVVGGNAIIAGTFNKGPSVLQPADWTLCFFMGVRARRLTPGASVSDFVIATGGPLDAFGGPPLASLPYFNTPLTQTQVTLPANLFSATEQNTLEDDGFSTYGVNPAGTAMIMGPVVTTWTEDDSGNPNVSFHYLNYVDTGSACREIIFNTLRSTYAQSRLTEGDLIPGYAMANAESIKTEILRIYRVLANSALTQAGREAESYFATNTVVTVELATRSVTISGPLPIVTQIGTIDYSLQLSFTVGSTGSQITF